MSDTAKETKLGHNRFRFVCVTTQQQLTEAFIVRAICFVHEHSMKTSLVFDGNDTQATHLLMYDDDEPIGTSRLRWFKDFAKVERTCIRQEWRNPRTVKALCEFMFQTAARKGYDKLVTHANPKFATMWQRSLGFRLVEGKEPVRFEGEDEPFIELVRHLDVPENAITAQSDANMLYRIEGHWDEPLQFEKPGVK